MLTRRRLCACALCSPILLSTSLAVRAAGNDAQLMQAKLSRVTEDITPGLYLTVDWEFDLSEILVDSMKRGIPLYFEYEFRLERPRWYWTNKKAAQSHLVQRVGYSPLSRRWRFSRGGLIQSFHTFEEVLPLLKHVGDWRVADVDTIDDIDDFQADTRLHLDLTKLPKPLQVSIGGNSDWALESDWENVHLSKDLTRR